MAASSLTLLSLLSIALLVAAASASASNITEILSGFPEYTLHVLLDYFDAPKLHKISEGSVLSTTLYQTTGNAAGNLGFVNITDLRGGKVGFGSGVPGSPLDSTFTKSVKQVPYNLSVIEVSKAIAPSAVLTAPAPSASAVNITALLEKAGCLFRQVF
ncbi:UNVERIFIED_CONTAM: Fasciclin-like arabinogalactan protein 8 [Sesamum radiatum]|uniref:Fasciclin-like arabinogalactan protein 8 n=1 Tax=Sesamum radiatum TaxID=300843 RepID=A0AAW2VH12_SESRA